MKIALVEPNLTGHRITYLKHYMESFVNAGHTVYVLCPENSELKKGLNNSLLRHIHFIDFNVEQKKRLFFQTTLNALSNWRGISKKLKKKVKNVDGVFFMSLDTFNAFFYRTLTLFNIPLYRILNYFIPIYIDSVFSYKWGGIFLGPRKDQVQFFNSRNNVAIGILESTFSFGARHSDKKVIRVPDITNTHIEEAASELEKDICQRAKGRKIVSLLGRIHKRKGVLTLLETAERMKNSDYFFVFAGEPAMNSFSAKQREKMDQVKKESFGNCFFHFERVEDGHEFNSLVRVSDILFAAYLNFQFSSNLITKASYFKKPVIVSDTGYMKEAVENYKMGVAIEEGSVSDCISAIKEIDDSFQMKEASFEKYFGLNSVDRIDEVIREFQNKLSAK